MVRMVLNKVLLQKLTMLGSSFIVATLLVGCGGGGAKTYYMNRTTTLGQELTDLKTAYEQGAITEQEYVGQRSKLLKGQDS
jgi:hypothetical protein